MTGTRPVGVVVTVLVVLALAVGGVAAGVSAGGHSTQDGVESEESAPGGSVSGPTFDGPGVAQGSSEVGLELRPTNQTVAPGGNATYDIVITDPENGTSGYSFNVSVGSLGVAEIDGFTLDRNPLADNSFITDDNRTLALDVALGGNNYAPAPEVTVATVNVTAVGSPDDSTDIGFEYDPNESVLDNDNILYTVTSDQSASLRIDAPPEFLVSNLTPADATVVEGETLNVSADVTNVGGSGTQTVSLGIDGFSRNKTVTLGNGQNQTVTFESVDTGALGAGSYQHTVSSANESVSGNLTVLSAANFAVGIAGTSTPVEGERLNVTAEVTNTGDVEDTQTIALAVGALGGDSTNVTLGGGASTSVTLSVGTGSGDAGAYTATVSSADDSASANVTVLAPANFAVALTETTTPVEGEQLNVTAEVTNTGDVEATQTVTLDVGSLGTDSTSVTLGGGASTNLPLSVGTGSGDAGAYTATVSSADDSDSANVTVLEPANFAVSITETTTPVEGERLNVTTELQNTGDVEDTQTIALDVGALGTDSTTVTLGGGASTNLTLSVGTGAGDAGTYTATVSGADDSDSRNVTVLEPANFAVSVTGTTTPVEGDSLSVSTLVENTGDVGATQTVELDAGALGTDATNVTLGGGASTNVTLSVGTSGGDAGAYTATVSSADDSETANVTVLSAANFTVSLTAFDSEVTAGENASVDVEVVNTGDVEATQTVTLDVGALGSNATTVTLATGESTNLTLSVPTQEGDGGEYTTTVSSADDTETATVTVLAQAGDVGLSLSPVDGTAEQGENATYNITVTGADNGISAYSFNVSVADLGVAEIDGFALDRTGFFDNSFITGDNRTLALDVGLGENGYAPAPAVTVATVNVTAVGGPDDSTDIGFEYDPNQSVLDSNSALYTVTSDQSASFTVDAPPEFLMSNLTPADATVVEGETLNISANVTNVGGSGTQTVSLDVDGFSQNRTVTLGNGQSRTVTFEAVDTGALGAGEYQHTVSSANESVSGNLTVLAPANFVVSIAGTGTPVEGEQLNVSAEIANTGEEANTQTIALDVGSLGSASTSVTLAGGVSTNLTLSVSTGAGDAGAYTATVSSADDADTASVTVLAPAAFAVDLVETSAPVEGERLVVTTAVENTGGVEGTQTLTLDVGALGSNSTSVTLGGGESTNLTLSVGTGSGDAGEYTATVSGADDADTATVTVLEPAAFAVTLADAGGPVTGGETLTVEYAVENTGDVTATQTVAFAVDGTTEATESNLTLAGGETFAGEFSYETDEGDVPGVTVSVASADDTATANVTVLAPAAFAVELTGTGGSVVAGESLTVSYEVTNTGDVGATQTVEFAVEGTVEATESVTLGGGETFAGGFSYETTGGDVPKLNVSVASADDTVTETVTVLSPGAFVVGLTSIDDSVVAGENLTVAYEVTNSGDTEATQTVEIAVAGTVEDTQSVTLGGGETFAGEFSYETGEGDVPGLNVSVSSVDDTVTATVPVLEPAAFAVTLTDVAGPVVAGESLTVGYEVTNTGGVEATQTVEFAVDGVTEDTETNVTLGGEETFTGQFAYETVEEDVPGVNVSVSSTDDTATETVAVLEPALFEVALTGIDSEVTAGETVTVDYEVTNTGDVEATQAVEFAVEGTVEDSEANVTLGSGETLTGQFAYETVEEDVPGVTVSVSSADDTVTETVAVLASVDPTPALSNLTIAGDGNETLVLDGAGENVTVDVTNLGTTSTAFNVTLTLEGPETVELTETVAVGGGETTALTFENATDAVDAGAYNVTLSAADAELTGTLTVSVTIDDGQPATDTTGDARLNDIDGDRAFSIFDVQEFFVNFQTPTLQNNPAAFNFDGSGDGEVNIFDVQALFVELVLQDT